MKAVVIHAAHDLRIEDREPQALGEGQLRVAIEAGGICGSDLHYYHDGGFGAIRLREPMILGHEIAGRIVEGTAEGLAVGDRVAVSPSRPCFDCTYCQQNMHNHCLNMRFYGSAMPMPHIQGAFREELNVDAAQCFAVGQNVSAGEAAMAEPLAVVQHALVRAGALDGRRVLVTGCGPIGALCVLSARAAGAAEVVVTDILDPVLALARQIGADRAVNVAAEPDWTRKYSANKGHFDVMFEASGNQAALRSGLDVLRPRATLVQLGLGGDISIPQNLIVSKEIDIKGAFRFHEEFGTSVDLINSGTLDLAPLITDSFPVDQAVSAFDLASDRSGAMKVQLQFSN